jgi:uncharacterized protein YkwD
VRRTEVRRTGIKAARVRALACIVLTAALAACLNATVAGTGNARPGSAADVIGLVNDVRLRGCPGQRAASKRLAPDAALDAVAARLARGGSLAAAVQAEKYPAQRSASIAVESAPSPAALEKLFESDRYCRLVTDTGFTRIGVAGANRGATIVLAALFMAPALGDAAAMAQDALTSVNAARAKPRRCGSTAFAAASPLVLHPLLTSAAAAHARDMASRGRMSHAGSDGSTPEQRISRTGYPWRLAAENVAAGQTTVDEVIATWLASPGHCANIMNPALREMGIAFVFAASSPDGTYWTQTLGTRR